MNKKQTRNMLLKEALIVGTVGIIIGVIVRKHNLLFWNKLPRQFIS